MRRDSPRPPAIPQLVRGEIARQQIRVGTALEVTQDEQIQDLYQLDYAGNEDQVIMINSSGDGLDTAASPPGSEPATPDGTATQYWRGDKTWQELPEAVQDIVGAMLLAGAGVSLAYDDVAGTVTITCTITQYTDEMARDALGTALVAGTGLTKSINDPGDTITFAIDTSAEAERVRDTIGATIVGGTGITSTVNDGADTITIATTITQYTDEMARDALGAALTAGANITLTVNDASDTITIAVSGLGTAAFKNTGTSGDAVPLLNGTQATWTNGALFGGSSGFTWGITETKGGFRVWDASAGSYGLRIDFTGNVPFIQGYRETVGVINLNIQPLGGGILFGGGLGNYANDAAAAAGGVSVGQLYRNGSVVMIRVA